MASEDMLISDFDELETLEDSDMFLVEGNTTHNAKAITLKNYILSEDILTEISKFKNISEEDIKKAIIKGSMHDYPQYGVCYDANTKSPILQRVGASVGMVAGTGVGADNNVVNDFDDIYPWSAMKRCTMTANGTITAYKGDVNYTEDGSIGNVMVEIPKFYIKRVVDENSGLIYRYICKEKLAGYRLPEGFIRNGQEVEKIYVAAYPSSVKNNQYSSVAGVDLDAGIAYESYADLSVNHKIADNWHCLDLPTMEILQTLFIVEFSTLNSKSVLKGCLDYGNQYTPDAECVSENTSTVSITGTIEENRFYVGQVLYFSNTDSNEFRTVVNVETENITTTDSGVSRKITITLNAPIKIENATEIFEWAMTGQCNNVTASSGECGHGIAGCVPFVYRGVENLYGCAQILIDGVKATSEGYFVANDINTYGDANKPTASSENYTLLSYDVPDTGFIDKLGTDLNVPYALLPESTAGTDNSAFCDEFNKGSNLNRTAHRILSNYNGLFSYDISLTLESTLSGRLVYAKSEEVE